MKMLSFIFDTETTGFPIWRSPSSHPDQPHLMQLAGLLVRGDDVIKNWETLVRCPVAPEQKAFEAHSITQLATTEKGVDLREALRIFEGFLAEADRAICHNSGFDFRIMRIAYFKANMNQDRLLSIPQFCTMRAATPVLKLSKPKGFGFKWPTLEEAYKGLVDTSGFSGAHDAAVDTDACFKVMLALENRGVPLKQTLM